MAWAVPLTGACKIERLLRFSDLRPYSLTAATDDASVADPRYKQGLRGVKGGRVIASFAVKMAPVVE